MKISHILSENEKELTELAERKVIEFADTINRSSEERAFLRKAIIDVAHSSQTNLIKGLVEEVEGMKVSKHILNCDFLTTEIICDCGLEYKNNTLQKVIDLLNNTIK